MDISDLKSNNRLSAAEDFLQCTKFCEHVVGLKSVDSLTRPWISGIAKHQAEEGAEASNCQRDHSVGDVPYQRYWTSSGQVCLRSLLVHALRACAFIKFSQHR